MGKCLSKSERTGVQSPHPLCSASSVSTAVDQQMGVSRTKGEHLKPVSSKVYLEHCTKATNKDGSQAPSSSQHDKASRDERQSPRIARPSSPTLLQDDLSYLSPAFAKMISCDQSASGAAKSSQSSSNATPAASTGQQDALSAHASEQGGIYRNPSGSYVFDDASHVARPLERGNCEAASAATTAAAAAEAPSRPKLHNKHLQNVIGVPRTSSGPSSAAGKKSGRTQRNQQMLHVDEDALDRSMSGKLLFLQHLPTSARLPDELKGKNLMMRQPSTVDSAFGLIAGACGDDDAEDDDVCDGGDGIPSVYAHQPDGNDGSELDGCYSSASSASTLYQESNEAHEDQMTALASSQARGDHPVASAPSCASVCSDACMDSDRQLSISSIAAELLQDGPSSQPCDTVATTGALNGAVDADHSSRPITTATSFGSSTEASTRADSTSTTTSSQMNDSAGTSTGTPSAINHHTSTTHHHVSFHDTVVKPRAKSAEASTAGEQPPPPMLPRKFPLLMKSNSTSTLFIRSTMRNPDCDRLLTAVCTALHHHVKASEARTRHTQPFHPQLFSEKLYPMTRKYPLPAKYLKNPSVRTIQAFVNRLFTDAQLTAEVGVVFLVYVERLIKASRMSFDGVTWRWAVLGCIALAAKVWDDLAVWNIDFVNRDFMPNVTVRRLNRLEAEILQKLDFRMVITSSLYAKYYFELRQISQEYGKDQELPPLDSKQAQQMDVSYRKTDNAFLSSKPKKGSSSSSGNNNGSNGSGNGGADEEEDLGMQRAKSGEIIFRKGCMAVLN